MTHLFLTIFIYNYHGSSSQVHDRTETHPLHLQELGPQNAPHLALLPYLSVQLLEKFWRGSPQVH